jgi:hypothetical protein
MNQVITSEQTTYCTKIGGRHITNSGKIDSMKKYMVFFLLLFPFFSQSQTKNWFDKFIDVNYRNIDTNNVESKAMLKVWTSYLKSRIWNWGSKNDTVSSKFWNDDEQKQFTHPCNIFEIYPGLFFFHTSILNIEPVEDNYFRILNCTTDSDSSRNITRAIYYILIKKTEGHYKLFNFFYLEKEKLNTTTIGTIKYYYPEYYNFSRKKANSFINFKDSLSLLFNQPVQDKSVYVVDSNTTSLMSRFGFIFQTFLTNQKTGKFLKENDMIISSIDENHRHELVHYFTTFNNPDRIGFFDEGLATYFGGSMGHDLRWHINKFYTYFITKMHSDTSKIMSLLDLDRETNPQYTLGAIIMKYAIDTYGFQKVLKLLSYTQKKDTTEEVIEKELGIPKDKLSSFLLDCMIKYPDLRPYNVRDR